VPKGICAKAACHPSPSGRAATPVFQPPQQHKAKSSLFIVIRIIVIHRLGESALLGGADASPRRVQE
jgi:hypothetical protein